ncbi:MAG: MGMT family protein [Actinobacteria bacterium]|nr:MGMT family protein [Actinomycetota bacterium]
MYAAFSDHGVSLVHPAESGDQFATMFTARTGRIAREADALDHPDISEALHACETATLACDLDGVSPFTRRVLDAATQIERGQTRSYQWLARRIGMPRAARAVGNALGANPVPLVIPCHRVVRGDGSLGGYALGARTKRLLLEAEGALPAVVRV